MMEKLEKIVSLLPAFTAIALVSAVFYNFGFIFPFGIEWITALTVKDLLALTWSSFPIVALGAVFAATVGSATHSPSKVLADLSNRILDADRWYSLVFALLRMLYIVAAVSIPVWATLVFGMYSGLPPATIVRLLPLVGMVHLSGVVLLFRTSNAADQERTRVPAGVYQLMVIVLMMGSVNGYSRMLSDPRYLVTDTGERTWCATLVHMTDRGPLLYDPGADSISLIRWDTVRSIAKKKVCSAKPAGGAVPGTPAAAEAKKS